MRDKDIVFCSLCICYDNGCPFCKRCPSAQKIPAYRESWRQLMYMHTNLHSETCLKRLSKAQAKLICRVEVALRKVKQICLRKFQDTCKRSPKQGVCKGAWSLLQVLLYISSVPQPHDEPCTGRLQAGLRVMLTSVGLNTSTGTHPQKIHCST